MTPEKCLAQGVLVELQPSLSLTDCSQHPFLQQCSPSQGHKTGAEMPSHTPKVRNKVNFLTTDNTFKRFKFTRHYICPVKSTNSTLTSTYMYPLPLFSYPLLCFPPPVPPHHPPPPPQHHSVRTPVDTVKNPTI